jgi:hypothetical protein
MKVPRLLLRLAPYLFACFTIHAQTKQITATEAKNHVGERATVCGTVASARYADKTKGQPTFLNLDEPYPREIFTVLIWGSERPKFGSPEVKYASAKVCVTGEISSYRGAPEIVVNDPNQLAIQK